MTLLATQQATKADTAEMRTDVARLLQEVGNPARLDVSGQDLQGVTLMNSNLRGSNLSQAKVCEANLCGAHLSQADLHGADLRGTYMCWADLRGANLHEADLREADLSWADLRGANLRGVNLDGAILYGASLARADLREVSLDRVNLRGVDLSWASLGGGSSSEQAKNQLRRRGAIFRDRPNVSAVKPFSEKGGRYTLGFSLGFLSLSVIGFLCTLGMRLIFTSMRLKRRSGDEAPWRVGPSPGPRS